MRRDGALEGATGRHAVTVVMNISTPDAVSFRYAQGQIPANAARAIESKRGVIYNFFARRFINLKFTMKLSTVKKPPNLRPDSSETCVAKLTRRHDFCMAHQMSAIHPIRCVLICETRRSIWAVEDELSRYWSYWQQYPRSERDVF